MHKNQNTNRRDFLKRSSLGGMMAFSIPGIVGEAFAAEKAKKISLQENDVVLFQGDSITDAGRDKENREANNAGALGHGYAFDAGSELLYTYPGKSLKVYNTGISGNKVFQLADRWDADALTLKPNVLSILIGVNDFWHTLTNHYEGTIETYRNDFNALLERTKKQLPDVRLIIGEPYAVKGIKAVDESWYPAFDEYRKAAREIADKFETAWIPYQSVFDKAQKQAPGSYWTADGVHPTVAGAQLMAHAWLATVK